jgi:hypothetical protein
MTRVLLDLQAAFHSFVRTPVFTLVAIFSLALGIGAKAAITLLPFTSLSEARGRRRNQLQVASPLYFGGPSFR